jgi:hypothetical protein
VEGARTGDALELVAILGRGIERLEQRFGTLERGATRVEPERRFAFALLIRDVLAEAERTLVDRLAAAATFGAPGRGGFEDVGHAPRIHNIWTEV